MASKAELEEALVSAENKADSLFRQTYFVKSETTEKDYEKLKQILSQLRDDGLKIPDDQLLPIHKIFREKENPNVIKSEEDIVVILYTQALLAAASYGLQDPIANQFWESVPRLLALADNMARDFGQESKPNILDKIRILERAEYKEADKILASDLVKLPSLQGSNGQYSAQESAINNPESSISHLQIARNLQRTANEITEFRSRLGIKPSVFSLRVEQNVKQNIIMGR